MFLLFIFIINFYNKFFYVSKFANLILYKLLRYNSKYIDSYY